MSKEWTEIKLISYNWFHFWYKTAIYLQLFRPLGQKMLDNGLRINIGLYGRKGKLTKAVFEIAQPVGRIYWSATKYFGFEHRLKEKQKNIFVAIIRDPFYRAPKRPAPIRTHLTWVKIRNVLDKIIGGPVLKRIKDSRLTARRCSCKNQF